ncbi:B-cell receptor CD22-like isoform X2 [Mobula birostris]|uniref:B-cell receptor CD22-like isoform X2 n=1 Tax=Mobula birostris TaxID=1983395 RepID=UPI003B27E5B1
MKDAPTNVRITSPSGAPVSLSITLWCESDANPEPHNYSWRKVCGSSSVNLQCYSRGCRLWITRADISCDYYCTVRNSIGERESPPKRIIVQYKPKDVKILSSDSVVEGSQVTLRCESVGNPPADTYQWKKVCSGMEMRLKGSTHELQIQVSAEDESCAYYCRAGNVIGDQDSEPKHFNVQYAA